MGSPEKELRTIAVMYTDMAGSTAFAERFGSRMAHEKGKKHNSLLLPLIKEHHGNLVRMIGDASLSFFDDVADAARCAIAMQLRVSESNESDRPTFEFPEDEIHIRIGIHYGKSVVSWDGESVDLFGRSVNTGSRVESGGGKQTDLILISAAALVQLHLQPGEFASVFFGQTDAKGVGTIDLYSLLWRPDTLAAATVEPVVPHKEIEENKRAVHGLFLDTQTDRGYSLPVWVRIVKGQPPEIRAQGDSDAVMQAAATRAIRIAFELLRRFGFADAELDRQVVEWLIEGPKIHYEGASLGLAVALATVAAYSGVETDPGIAVTGAVDGERVVRVAGVGRKWQALRASGHFHTMIVPTDNLAELPTAARNDPSLRVIDVPSVEAAVLDVLGPALGLATDRLAEIARPASSVAHSEVGIQLWVQREERRELTRDIGIVPAEDTHSWNVGDRIRICAQVNRDCHLAVINIGPTGNVTVLIPNAYHSDAIARAGQVVTFPGANDPIQFELKGPPGGERLIALASARPLRLTPQDFDQSGKLVCARPTTRDIAIVADSIGDAVLGRCEIEFYVSSRDAARSPIDASRSTIDGLTEGPALFRPIDLH
jgi:class 3 adenylate cyclase